MSSVPRDIIEANLLKKGFRRIEQHTDHRFTISTGSGYKDYSIDLLKKMKLQLKFESISQLLDFLRCPLGYREYLEILRRKSEL